MRKPQKESVDRHKEELGSMAKGKNSHLLEADRKRQRREVRFSLTQSLNRPRSSAPGAAAAESQLLP